MLTQQFDLPEQLDIDLEGGAFAPLTIAGEVVVEFDRDGHQGATDIVLAVHNKKGGAGYKMLQPSHPLWKAINEALDREGFYDEAWRQLIAAGEASSFNANAAYGVGEGLER